MAGKSTISITFKLDGDGKGFKGLAKDANSLKGVLSATISEAQQLNKSVINFAALATGLDAAQRSFSQLHGAMKDLADAYAVQEVNEQKLETVMRQRMNATEEEIQSIKNLASAQQELGVIGDEVQLSGAQQVATFLTEKKSLDILLPALNDLLAQQKGLNATTEDAYNIANLMGKAMQGQVSSLRRVGITFDEAEEEVLKFGTETERAAMLAQVITNNVGHMNAALAQTDSGKQQQLLNRLGDVKERLGGLVKGALPFVTIAAQSTTALASVTTLGVGIKKLVTAIVAFNYKAKAAAGMTLLMGVNAKKSAAVMRVFSAALTTGAHSATAMKLALRGLLIATGVGAAIMGVTAAIEAMTSSSAKAAEKEAELAEELANFKNEIRDIGQTAAENVQKEVAALDRLYKVASNETASRKERSAAIREMQSLYPDYFGNITDEVNDISKLTSGYEKLRDSILESARARAAEKKIEENTGKLLDIEQQIKAKREEVSTLEKEAKEAQAQYNAGRSEDVSERRNRSWLASAAMAGEKVQPITSGELNMSRASEEVSKYNSQLSSANSELSALITKQNELNAANQELADIVSKTPSASSTTTNSPTITPTTENSPSWKEGAANLKDISANIDILSKKLQTASIEEAAIINQQIADWQAKADAIRNAGKEVENAPVAADAPVSASTDTGASSGPTWNASASNLKDISSNIEILNSQLQTASIEEAALINQQIANWQAKADAIRDAGKEAEKTSITTGEALLREYGAIKQIGGSVEGLNDALKGHGSAWQIVTGIVDGFIGLYEGISTIVSVINMLTGASAAHAAMKGVESTAETTEAATRTAAASTGAAASAVVITANKLEAASWKELAASMYMAAHAYIPFAGFGIAAGFTASMLAVTAAAGIPMLASGGIADGPTLAMVGEYPGASSNPEVIAPLNKLKGMLQDEVGGYGGRVEFEIKGRTLVGILSKENNISRRS